MSRESHSQPRIIQEANAIVKSEFKRYNAEVRQIDDQYAVRRLKQFGSSILHCLEFIKPSTFGRPFAPDPYDTNVDDDIDTIDER